MVNLHSKLLCCFCHKTSFFEPLLDVECDWGTHDLIQCPNCELLFSIDIECPAFESLVNLNKTNDGFLTEREVEAYKLHSHPYKFCDLVD